MQPKLGTMYRLLPETKNELLAVTQLGDAGSCVMEDSWGRKFNVSAEQLQASLTTGKLVEEKNPT